MSYQLHFEGFPVQLIREAYTPPPQSKEATPYRNPNPQPILRMSVSTNSLTLYNDFSEFSKKRKTMELAARVPVKRTPGTGLMSKQVRTSMKRALNNLFLISKVKTCYNTEQGYYYTMRNNFITLTLSDKQKHTDHFIKQVLLKNFFDNLRRSMPSISYVWKAEPQKNGNIHFHIITDHFIDKSVVNRVWNAAQSRHGYTDKYFASGKGRNPPSTETRKVKGHERSANYMCKYFVKDFGSDSLFECCAKKALLKNKADEITSNSKLREWVNEIELLLVKIDALSRRKIQGKLWGCSDNLLVKPYNEIFESLPSEDQEYIVSQKSVSKSDYYETFVFSSFKDLLSGLSPSVQKAIRFYYRLLVRPIPIPDIIYRTGLKYSYS